MPLAHSRTLGTGPRLILWNLRLSVLLPARIVRRVHVSIEMRKPGNTAWELIGYFSATEEEMLELQDAFKGLNNPYEMIGRISNRMISDVLAFLKADGCEARIQFHADD
jgi:hypothetical protein